MIGQIVIMSAEGVAVSKKARLGVEMGIVGMIGGRKEAGPKKKNITAEGCYIKGNVDKEVDFIFLVGNNKFGGEGFITQNKDKQITIRLNGELNKNINKLIKKAKQWQDFLER